MNNIAEMKQQASVMRKQQRYEEAITLYRALWEEHRDECNEWDGWGYAQSLRKLGRSQEALDVCREAYPLKPDFDYLRNLYAWCIYDLEIKRDDSEIEKDEGRFLKAANAILELVEPGQYSPYARTVIRVVDYFKDRASYPAAKILEWTDKLDPNQLSDQPGNGTAQTGKPIEYASDREKWYAARSKALLEVGRFQDCIALSEQALSAFSRFHYDNDIWFKWRMALAKGELGDKETAIDQLQTLLAKKKDAFIYHRMAQYLFDLGRVDEAFNHAVEGALGPGELGYKWELFLLMGAILKAQSKLHDARKHTLLAAKIRQEQGWKIPSELSQAVQEMDIDMSSVAPAHDLYKELSKFWQSLKFAGMPQVEGEIKNLLSNGRSGFICGDDGKDYYFKIKSFRGAQHLLVVGQRVRFYVEENPDPSKRDSAVHIKPVKSA